MSDQTCANCKHWMRQRGTDDVGECAEYARDTQATFYEWGMKSCLVIVHCLAFSFGSCIKFEACEDRKDGVVN